MTVILIPKLCFAKIKHCQILKIKLKISEKNDGDRERHQVTYIGILELGIKTFFHEIGF